MLLPGTGALPKEKNRKDWTVPGSSLPPSYPTSPFAQLHLLRLGCRGQAALCDLPMCSMGSFCTSSGKWGCTDPEGSQPQAKGSGQVALIPGLEKKGRPKGVGCGHWYFSVAISTTSWNKLSSSGETIYLGNPQKTSKFIIDKIIFLKWKW